MEMTHHHGNLSEALIAAAIQLNEEGGPEKVSVREAAKRAQTTATSRRISTAAPSAAALAKLGKST
jgi:hypothetical protein